MIKKWYHI